MSKKKDYWIKVKGLKLIAPLIGISGRSKYAWYGKTSIQHVACE